MSQKNKYNVFTKAGFNETQTRDAHGKWSKKPGKLEDRPCFKEWFKDSKATGPNGDPKTFYHGTTHEFNEFSKERGNPENDLGIGFYFSNSIQDVQANYDEIGPDLTGRINQYIDQLENENFTVEMTDEELRRRAEAQLVGKVNKIIPVYLSIKDPVVIGDPVFYGEEQQTFFDYSQNYNDETEEFGEETGLLLEWAEAAKSAINDYEDAGFMSLNYNRVISDVFEQVSDGINAKDLVSIMKSSEGLLYAMDENGKMAQGEIIRGIFEEMGYDGIIDNTIPDKFGPARRFGQAMAGVHSDTQHIIAFEPNQIKRTDAKSFCHETDIRKSGAIIIDHKAGFQETQRRDRSGKWTDKWAGMLAFEDEHRYDKKETAALYDKNGKKKWEKKGSKSAVNFSKDEIDAIMEGDIMTHNHPIVASFSEADIRMLLRNPRLSKFRAFDAKHLYEMEFFGKYNDIAFRNMGQGPIQVFNNTFSKIQKEVFKETDKIVNGLEVSVRIGKKTKAEANKIIKSHYSNETHEVWLRFMETKFGSRNFKYSRK